MSQLAGVPVIQGITYRDSTVDPFKDAVSLPGLTQRYLFQNLDLNDYFVGIGREHKHCCRCSEYHLPSILLGG